MSVTVPGGPFSMSPDAALWVVEQVRAAEAHPEAAGMVPALFYVIDSTQTDAGGRIVERVPYSHYEIGWYSREQVDGSDGDGSQFVRVDVLDRTLFVEDATLDELRGKELRLHRVDSMLSARPGAPPRYVLRAGVEEKGIFKAADV
jgi:hypothetical protein